jgi:hypothetical protein
MQNQARDANGAVPTAEDNETMVVRFVRFVSTCTAVRADSLYRTSSGPSASLSTDAAACTTGITRS